MENKNWLQKKASNIENNITKMDDDFSKVPPYKAGRKAGAFISSLIDFIVDGIAPSK
ncbi:hypothetical protein [Polaribacter sp.]|uniref:hypothetical protein n=1 Tax=Polaribacter sp. TaxID=1920175 RepID=UPI003EF1347A